MTEQIRSMLNVEAGEERPVLLLFVHLAAAVANFVLARAVRDAIFLDRYSVLELPYVYIGVAVVSGLFASFYLSLSSRIGQTRLIRSTLWLLMLSVLAIWWGVRVRAFGMPFFFYAWTSLLGVVLTTQVWTIAARMLDTRQARRLFPLIGSGGILGGILGGSIAAAGTPALGTDNLILLLLVPLGVAAAAVKRLARDIDPLPAPAGAGRRSTGSLRHVAGMTGRLPYLRLIATAVALSAIVTLIIDFQFKRVVEQSVGTRDELTIFFGYFYGLVGVLSFLLQFLGGSRISDRYGVRATLMFLPALLVSSTAVLLAYPLSLWAGVALKGWDGALRHSINRSSVELLYAPLPAWIRGEIKTFIDIVVERTSDAMGGILLLVMVRIFAWDVFGTAVVNAALLVVWLWVAWKIRKEYVAVVRASLAERQIPAVAITPAQLGGEESISTLRSMLDSRDEEFVLYAMDVAEAIGRRDLVRTESIDHPSRNVRYRALDFISIDSPGGVEKPLRDASPAVRAKAIAVKCRLGLPECTESAVQSYIGSPDLNVRLAAIIVLSKHPALKEAEHIGTHLENAVRFLDDASPEWLQVTEALGEIRHPDAVRLHARLLAHPNSRVRRQAVASAGRSRYRELVGPLTNLLADPELGDAARHALQEYGGRIVGTLGDILRDEAEPLAIRRKIPDVLAAISEQASVDVLIEALGSDGDGLLRFRAIRALNRLRIGQRRLWFDSTRIADLVRRESAKALRYRHAVRTLYPDGTVPDLLAQLLRDKVEQGEERVFRLLALILAPTAAQAVHRALTMENPSRQANAAEYLDNVLDRNLRQWVLPLFEDRTELFEETREQILARFLSSPDPVLHDCTVDAIMRRDWLGRNGLAESVARLREGFSHG